MSGTVSVFVSGSWVSQLNIQVSISVRESWAMEHLLEVFVEIIIQHWKEAQEFVDGEKILKEMKQYLWFSGGHECVQRQWYFLICIFLNMLCRLQNYAYLDFQIFLVIPLCDRNVMSFHSYLQNPLPEIIF